MINPSELKIETLDDPTTRKGGQHVGVPVLGVRVTHVPSGIAAECRFERSQYKNKIIATAMIEYGLAELNWGK